MISGTILFTIKNVFGVVHPVLLMGRAAICFRVVQSLLPPRYGNESTYDTRNGHDGRNIKTRIDFFRKYKINFSKIVHRLSALPKRKLKHDTTPRSGAHIMKNMLKSWLAWRRALVMFVTRRDRGSLV